MTLRFNQVSAFDFCLRGNWNGREGGAKPIASVVSGRFSEIFAKDAFFAYSLADDFGRNMMKPRVCK